jgi:hypothetical protein
MKFFSPSSISIDNNNNSIFSSFSSDSFPISSLPSLSLKEVRDVAPLKVMMRATFSLPLQIACYNLEENL